MVGDADVLPAQRAGGGNHFLQIVVTVRLGRVAMERAADVAFFDERGEFFFGGDLQLAGIFAQFGGDVGIAESCVDFFFRAGCFFERRLKSVLAEGEAALFGSLAQVNVVVFIAGEVEEGKGVFFFGDDAEIGLDAVFQADGGFGGAEGEYFFDPGLMSEPLRDFSGRGRGDDDVEVADGLEFAAGASGELGFFDFFDRGELLDEGLGDFLCIPPEDALSECS